MFSWLRSKKALNLYTITRNEFAVPTTYKITGHYLNHHAISGRCFVICDDAIVASFNDFDSVIVSECVENEHE